MIEKQKSLLQTKETEKVSKKPLSDDELSSLIKASNNKKFTEAELKVKKNENESFKKITLHDIATVSYTHLTLPTSSVVYITGGGG